MTETLAYARRPFYRHLYFQVLVAIVLGISLGFFAPAWGERMKPLGDGFIRLIGMMTAPIIFQSSVTGISGIGDLKKLGRVGVKAIVYFEVITTMALLIGLGVVTWIGPGVGINADPATLDTKAVAQYTTSGEHLSTVDFILNVIPDQA